MSSAVEIPAVAAEGVSRLYEWGGIVTLLILVVISLMFFCVYLIRRNNELGDKFIQCMIESTRAITEFKEALRDVSRKS